MPIICQAFKDKVRNTAAASSSNGVPAEPADQEIEQIQQRATYQYLNFLTSIAQSTGEPLQLKYLQRCAFPPDVSKTSAHVAQRQGTVTVQQLTWHCCRLIIAAGALLLTRVLQNGKWGTLSNMQLKASAESNPGHLSN